MRNFAALFESLDTTTSTKLKVEAMVEYFRAADPGDAAWATYVLTGRRLKRQVSSTLLHTWLSEEAQLPPWLVEETYASIGDMAETIALLIAPQSERAADAPPVTLSQWLEQRIMSLAGLERDAQRRLIVGWWRELPYRECFLVNKLLTGSLRVGVSRSLVARALSELFGQSRAQIERALIGSWAPSGEFWRALAGGEHSGAVSHPYPFYLASPLEGPVASLGDPEHWLAEWKWDGIRGQIVRRGGECTLWSRGEEIISERFPDLIQAANALPAGTVLDGEVLAWGEQGVLGFAQLQKRIGRRSVSAKLLKEIPARFLAYDLIEWQGEDWRSRPLDERRAQLQATVSALPSSVIALSPALAAPSWPELEEIRGQARAQAVEGLMLKARQSAYGAGRQRGAWWKWKIDPFVFDAVLLYAAPGHGRRSNLYTDYTFGVWSADALVPVAKAYSGLTDEEIRRLDKWIRGNTREKFGIVRSVQCAQVFELAFEGIARSTRHKSGIALRFPRITQWRRDKAPQEADTLATLQSMLS